MCQFREDRFDQGRICHGRAEKGNKDLDPLLFLWFSRPTRITLDRRRTALQGVRLHAHAGADQPEGPCGSGEPRHVRCRILRPRSLRLLTSRFWRLFHFEISDVWSRWLSIPCEGNRRNVRVSNFWESVTQTGPELRMVDSNIAQEEGFSWHPGSTFPCLEGVAARTSD